LRSTALIATWARSVVPARFSAIKREVQALGFTLEPPRGGGSHWKVMGPRGCFPIPAHNGLKGQVPDRYIQSLCRFLGVDFEEFRRRL
jgi:hypothetical protein